ncbi:N-6 DNA methylase [Breznakia pachnodae]|uniref:Type I restriction enzyme M protein n=1 Tax=Breznakia pachnodae TaxID=265178 RepID=A0ABU0DZA8_9FIRM|nr:N-6 DNA methylase [Breznakia pachnodae]MDQ0359971.1 type I restriction enzyme M protein [Breznakia pachnodae]
MSNYRNEAEVETKFVYSHLIKEILSIPSDRVSFHVPIKIHQGRSVLTKEADVVIKSDSNENLIVIDSKSPNVTLEQYFGQIDSYAFQLETPISILTNADRIIVRFYQEGNKKHILLDKKVDELETTGYSELIEIIDSVEKNIVDNMKISDEVETDSPKIVDYRRTFRVIHTKIRSIDKLDPSSAFDEFSKVLFIKIINDSLSDDEQLTIERIKAMGVIKAQSEFVDKWFQEKVSSYYPGIFAINTKIGLTPKALITVLDILNKDFDLKDSLTDIKGRAFEEFLPSQLRGKGLGQFFTPRAVVDFMIERAEISLNDKVLDFASGSGGFLIKAFEEKMKLIDTLPKVFIDALGKTREELEEIAKTQIFGIDAEPRAVRTAKMNMLLWGDGKQIQHGNGLDVSDFNGDPYLASEYNNDDPNSGVNVILANPPFGSTEEDQKVLSRYTLSKKRRDKNGEIKFSKVKTENLFVERAWKLLKPGGRLLIVLPEGIFSNKTSATRDFILSHFTIDTIVKLPKHSFVMSGVDTINTVVLVAYKNTSDRQKEIILSDKRTWINKNHVMTINFASVNQIGYEPSGKIIKRGYEGSDFQIIANKLKNNDFETIVADPLEYASIEYGDIEKSENWKKSMVKFLRIDFDHVPLRIDPTYYFFKKETTTLLSSFVSLDISENNTQRIKLTEKELNNNVEKVYKYVSVVKTLNGTVTEIEEKTVDDILSTRSGLPQRLYKNDIVFNPYRINTGSIIWIDSDDESLITSPAYVVLRNVDIDIKYLVQLLKTPFMKYQIQVLASGSVRDNFGTNDLELLRIPNISKSEQKEIMESVNGSINEIMVMQNNMRTKIEMINNLLSDFLK